MKRVKSFRKLVSKSRVIACAKSEKVIAVCKIYFVLTHMNIQTALVLVFIYLCLKALKIRISYTNWRKKRQ